MHLKCRDCDEEFDPDEKMKQKIGFFNQCIHCARRQGDVERYLGRPGLTNKDGSVEIFRTNLAFVRAVLRRESAIGFTANLRFDSPKSVQPEDKDDE